jgi:hypothetical protein
MIRTWNLNGFYLKSANAEEAIKYLDGEFVVGEMVDE